MTPFNPGQDVFQTQADQRFNSFSSPLNSMNTNSGDWGMNSAYMTPSFTSPYRPRYQGPQGDQNSGYKPGFFNSLNHVINPFEGGGTNYGGNTYAQSQAYYSAIGIRPIDAGMHAMQNIAIPMALATASYKFFGKSFSDAGERFGAGLLGKMGSGMGFGPAGASRFASAGGFAGKIAGGIALPMIAAQGAMSAIDGALFDPYMAQRATADTLRRNTSGISYGEGNGNGVNGGGMSRRFAAQQAGNISQMAAKDVTFSQMEVSQLTDFAGRSGLMDNVSSSQMSKRMKEITSQVKTVMAVANTSDFREAIEIMSKLQSSGVGSQRLSGTMGAIGGLASAAGMSTQRLMNTVGAQGQYLYGANGLTPYVGQLTAGQAAASFGTAFRSGLMSPALMARMGGVEGASQASNTGLLAALQSPYATAMGMNALHGGAQGSVVGNMTKFGASMASNPLSAIGHMNMLRPALLSNMAENEGLHSVQMQLAQMGKIIPGALNNKGKMDTGVMYQLMTGMMGIQGTEAMSMIEDMRGRLDPKSLKMSMAGFDKSKQDLFLKFADQNSMNKGIFTYGYNGVANFGRKVQAQGANAMNILNRGVGGAVDYTEKGLMGSLYGEGNREGEISAKDFARKGSTLGISLDGARKILGYNPGRMDNGQARTHELHSINDAAAKGDEDAITLVKSTDRMPKLQSIMNLVEKGVLDPKFAESKEAHKLETLISGAGTASIKAMDNDSTQKVANAVMRATGMDPEGFSTIKGMEVLSLSEQLHKNPKDASLMKKISALTGKDIDPTNVNKYLDSIDVGTAANGTRPVIAAYDEMSKILGMDSATIQKTFMAKGGKESMLKKLGISSASSIADMAAQVAAKQGRGLLNKSADLSKINAVNPGAAREYSDALEGIDNQRSILENMRKDNNFDFSEYTDSVNALDNKKNTLDFSMAVSSFSEAVDAFAKGKTTKSIVNGMNPFIIGNS